MSPKINFKKFKYSRKGRRAEDEDWVKIQTEEDDVFQRKDEVNKCDKSLKQA